MKRIGMKWKLSHKIFQLWIFPKYRNKLQNKIDFSMSIIDLRNTHWCITECCRKNNKISNNELSKVLLKTIFDIFRKCIH